MEFELSPKDLFNFDDILNECKVIELEKKYKVKESSHDLEVGEVILHDTEFWQANLQNEKVPIWLKKDFNYVITLARRPIFTDKENLIEVHRSLNIGSKMISIGLYTEYFKIEHKNLYLENKKICSSVILKVVSNFTFNSYRSLKIQKLKILIFLVC